MVKGYIKTDRELCKGCGICIEFCPKAAITLDTKVNVAGYIPAKFIDNGKCNGCGICAIVCPDVAVEVYRE
jgi:2-oxoglutarate ferredoxin oxidoreductase subunit delta